MYWWIATWINLLFEGKFRFSNGTVRCYIIHFSPKDADIGRSLIDLFNSGFSKPPSPHYYDFYNCRTLLINFTDFKVKTTDQFSITRLRLRRLRSPVKLKQTHRYLNSTTPKDSLPSACPLPAAAASCLVQLCSIKFKWRERKSLYFPQNWIHAKAL